jgi:uncharacterized protein (TIGR02118 family)
MTFQLTVLFHQPKDPAAFDDYYRSTHAPLAARIPGLRSYTASRPQPAPDGVPAAEHLVAALVLEDKAAFASGMGSPEGVAAGRDIGNFASGGVTMLSGEVTTYV